MVFDAERRAEAKRASRARDAARLAAGEITPAELSRENGLLSRERLRGVRLVRSGTRVLKHPRLLLP